MILDSIAHISRYTSSVPYLDEVIAFLEANNPDQLDLKEKTRISDHVFVIPISATQSPDAAATLEAHREWTDIHYTIKGSDSIVYKPSAECLLIKTEYNAEDDYVLFSDTYIGKLNVPESHFCIIMPETAHMALCGADDIVKLVFKIKANQE